MPRPQPPDWPTDGLRRMAESIDRSLATAGEDARGLHELARCPHRVDPAHLTLIEESLCTAPAAVNVFEQELRSWRAARLPARQRRNLTQLEERVARTHRQLGDMLATIAAIRARRANRLTAEGDIERIVDAFLAGRPAR